MVLVRLPPFVTDSGRAAHHSSIHHEGQSADGDAPTLYSIELGPWAALRGERAIRQVIEWTGRDDTYARVRVVESTVAGYWGGKVGIARRDRLVPLDGAPRAA